MTIKVFQNEINDGIGDLVKSTASVAYCSQAIAGRDMPEEVIAKALAENKDQIDLYYLESVLVSCGWNKNDDVFQAQATWEARNTPEDKQFNFMHNENDIIGHITGSYVLTKDGKAVADDDPMPEDFDIITQGVLYNSWTGAENRERMGKIIAEIQEGKWYVSMECLFAGFDYALIDKDGNSKVLARGEESSFLTKHLRAYGGTGEYEGYKIGRALRNISFSGKGLVSKPANPRSVILAEETVAQFHVDNNSELSIGELKMSDVLTEQLAEVKAQLEAAKAENEAIKAQIEEAKDKEFASKVEAFEAAADESKATIDQLNETIKSTQARVAELEDALAQSNQQLTEAKEHMEDMKKKEKSMKRKASLAEAGLDEDEVDETLASFDALEDDAFDAIVAMMKKKAGKKYAKDDESEAMDHGDKEDKKKKEAEAGMPPEVKEKMEEMKKKKEKEAKAEQDEAEALESFENLETGEASLSVAEDVDELDRAKAEVADWFTNHVLNK
jgi:hypothetical protein